MRNLNSGKKEKELIPYEVVELIADFMGNEVLGRDFQIELLIELLAKYGYEVRKHG